MHHSDTTDAYGRYVGVQGSAIRVDGKRRFKIVDTNLGTGMFGRCMKCADLVKKAPVAVKLSHDVSAMQAAARKEVAVLKQILYDDSEIFPEGSGSLDAEEGFALRDFVRKQLRDRTNAARRHIVKLLKAFVLEGHQGMAFEYVWRNLGRGIDELVQLPYSEFFQDLVQRETGSSSPAALLQREAPPPTARGLQLGFHLGLVRDWARQLFLGLTYLHWLGFIHCDLKTDNLLVSGAALCGAAAAQAVNYTQAAAAPGGELSEGGALSEEADYELRSGQFPFAYYYHRRSLAGEAAAFAETQEEAQEEPRTPRKKRSHTAYYAASALKIADFGTARSIERDFGCGQDAEVVGAGFYRAPEAFLGYASRWTPPRAEVPSEKSTRAPLLSVDSERSSQLRTYTSVVSPAMDLWAAACVVYEMFTKLVFRAQLQDPSDPLNYTRFLLFATPAMANAAPETHDSGQLLTVMQRRGRVPKKMITGAAARGNAAAGNAGAVQAFFPGSTASHAGDFLLKEAKQNVFQVWVAQDVKVPLSTLTPEAQVPVRVPVAGYMPFGDAGGRRLFGDEPKGGGGGGGGGGEPSAAWRELSAGGRGGCALEQDLRRLFATYVQSAGGEIRRFDETAVAFLVTTGPAVSAPQPAQPVTGGRAETEASSAAPRGSAPGARTPNGLGSVTPYPHSACPWLRYHVPYKVKTVPFVQLAATVAHRAGDLLWRLTALEPEKRLSACAALRHPFLAREIWDAQRGEQRDEQRDEGARDGF